jgi:hypothetical protein
VSSVVAYVASDLDEVDRLVADAHRCWERARWWAARGDLYLDRAKQAAAAERRRKGLTAGLR